MRHGRRGDRASARGAARYATLKLVPFDFLRIAERMLATPSVTTQGTAELVRFLCRAVVPDLPGEPLLLPEPDGADVNLLVVVPGRDRHPALLLNSHLDTVPPGERRAWTATGGNPFRPRRDGDRLVGLGSADAKLDWLCKAEALRRACVAGALKRTVYLLGTWGEERGLRGARRFLEGDAVPRPVAALVGEPTECRLVTQHKSLFVATVRFVAEPQRVEIGRLRARVRRYKGRAAHSATPEQGESAILKCLGDVADETPVIGIRGGDAANRVPALCELEVASTRRSRSASPDDVPDPGLRLMSPALFVAARDFARGLARLGTVDPRADPAFTPPRLTAGIGCIAGRGEALEITFDVRLLPGANRATVRQALDALVNEIKASYAGLRASLVVERDDPALPEAPRMFIQTALDAMAASGLAPSTATKAGCTEAGLYASAGIPAVVFGAGRSIGNIHAPNEWTSLSQLEGAVAFYAKFLRMYCGA